MDESVFDALDRLHARTVSNRNDHTLGHEARTRIDVYNTDRYEPDDARQMYPQQLEDGHQWLPEYDYSEQNFELDDFDRTLLQQPSWDSRQGQASLGQARLSLPPTQTYRNNDRSLQSLTTYQRSSPPVTYSSAHYLDVAPSSTILPSSPSYRASQRYQATGRPNRIPKKPNHYSLTPTSLPSPSPAFIHDEVDSHEPPVVRGIELVPVTRLPDRFRSLFPFRHFNAVQSRCFSSIYKSGHNFVLSSPTGSGKTAVFELAICRLISGNQFDTFKIVYMAPTKSLCAERKRDWKARFEVIGLQCEELTGDSDIASLHNVQSAHIIVTTPEKWDSMTRKWRDHEKLVRLIKLFLIDEVHILNKDRGAALEAVVSRMKSVGSDIRFVALSATVPNFHDIATWLGRDPTHPYVPADRESFGEEFRPVRLQKHVCGYQSTINPFAFDTNLNKKLPDVIAKYSQKKPLMVFCFTRKSCFETAKFLANWWNDSNPNKRYWKSPSHEIVVGNKDLRNTVLAGVAVHHAGLDADDRLAVEQGYLSGELSVICCTSTLSVGVNLPCHMVIIKNTASYEGSQVKEYSDLDIMQMIGRAGRPQFDTSAVAVIMTRLTLVNHYEHMMGGQEQLESCLHLNLVEHLNAEIGLGTITDLQSAKRWLQGTFLRVRLQENPSHYHIEGDTNGRSVDERLERICSTGIGQLTLHDLVKENTKLVLTEYGEAMARYYINYCTMLDILDIPSKPKSSEILSTLAQAHEFKEIRLRAGEKHIYKELNRSPGIRFPLKVHVALPAHKVTLMIQSVLGGVDTVADDTNHRIQYGIDQGLIFQHVHRLIRCIIDCQTYQEDAVGIRNALLLSRSFAAKVWDDSPLVLRQVDQLGPVAVRKLVAANISSIDELSQLEPGRIEHVLGRNPPFGRNILSKVKTFPKLRIEVQLRAKPVIKHGEYVTINLAVELGFLNESVPAQFSRKAVFVIMLAETSDGRMLHFCRISARKMAKAAPILFSARLTRPTQYINCYAMCDELAGTLRQVRMTPDIPLASFQSIKEKANHPLEESQVGKKKTTNQGRATGSNGDEWGDGGIDDQEFITAAERDAGYVDIDDIGSDNEFKGDSSKSFLRSSYQLEDVKDPQRLKNGKWACNHLCKDKSKCKHLCCREGLDRAPKIRRSKVISTESKKPQAKQTSKSQPKPNMRSKRTERAPIMTDKTLEHVDLSHPHTAGKAQHGTLSGTERHSHLHENNGPSQQVRRTRDQHPSYSYIDGHEPRLNFLEHRQDSNSVSLVDEDFDDSLMDELPDLGIMVNFAQSFQETCKADCLLNQGNDEPVYLDDDQEMLDAALVGAEDSHVLVEQRLRAETTAAAPSAGTQTFAGSNLQHNTPMMEGLDDRGLFISSASGPATQTIGFELDSHPLQPKLTKRKADDDTFGDDNPSIQGGLKRLQGSAIHPHHESLHKVTDLGEMSTRTRQTSQTLGTTADVEVKASEVEDTGDISPGTPELRAWLATELGDCVELVDFME